MAAAKVMTKTRTTIMASDTLSPDLTQDEIDRICYPLKQRAAQVRYLRDVLGLTVERRPGGQPLVWRVHVEAVKGPAMAGKRMASVPSTLNEPNMEATLARLAAKQATRKRHGPTTQGR
jgi:hypothetical protein